MPDWGFSFLFFNVWQLGWQKTLQKEQTKQKTDGLSLKAIFKCFAAWTFQLTHTHFRSGSQKPKLSVSKPKVCLGWESKHWNLILESMYYFCFRGFFLSYKSYANKKMNQRKNVDIFCQNCTSKCILFFDGV